MRVLIEGMSTRAWFISFTDFGACAIDFHCIVYSPACHIHRRSAPHPSHQCFVVVVEDMKTLEKVNEVALLQAQHQGQHEGVVQRIATTRLGRIQASSLSYRSIWQESV